MITESLAALELALEDEGWYRLTVMGEQEFSRAGLMKICRIARLMYLKNPLIQRGVNAQKYYVFGQGMTVRAKDPDVNEVVQDFLNDSKNKVELTSSQARLEKEVDLQVEANIFFCFFTTPSNGKVRLRTIPVDEVSDIVSNPEDAKEPWYYKRSWSAESVDTLSGIIKNESRTVYYPDWRYRPKESSERPEKIGDHKIEWDSPVYHVRVGGTSRMKFGVSEVYAALDWARAYKEFLENWATIVKAYARFAWKVAGLSDQTALEATKAKLESTAPATGTNINPPPVVGSTLLEPASLRMDPIRTSGATTSADDGRRLLLMVAAIFGMPETFFGDTSVGTLATAKSLDRPTELKMLSRQTLWADIHREIMGYVILQSVKAPSGKLGGTIQEEDDGSPLVELGEGKDPSITVSFPPILEHDIDEAVAAISKAATLDGKPLAGTMDLPVVSRLLLTALGEEDIDKMLEQMFPAGESAAETRLAIAAKELVEVVNGLKETLAA